MTAGSFVLPGGRSLGPGLPALVVAEIGQNHNGDPTVAEELVHAAAWAGCDAVKVVKRDLDSELTAAARERPYDSPHAYASTYGEHRARLELPWGVHAQLGKRARELGLVWIATACDVPSVRGLDALGVDAFKVASRDVNNGPLLAELARHGRAVLLSSGMSTLEELDAAVMALRSDVPLAVLQCTSLYPTPPEQVHLRSMVTLATRYGLPAGLSDHTLGTAVAAAAVALGAVVIEKHITLDRRAKGTDHAASLEPDDFRRLVETVREVEAALGQADKPLAPGVERTRDKLGRSLVTRTALPAGAVLDEQCLTLKSPGSGIPWTERHRLLGRRLIRDVRADEVLTAQDVD